MCLESMSRRNYYLYASNNGWAKLDDTTYPQNKEWAQWKIQCNNGNLNRCRFFHMRWRGTSRFLYTTWNSYGGIHAYDPKYSLFRIVVNESVYGDELKEDEELSIDELEAMEKKVAAKKDAETKAENPLAADTKAEEPKVADSKAEE